MNPALRFAATAAVLPIASLAVITLGFAVTLADKLHKKPAEVQPTHPAVPEHTPLSVLHGDLKLTTEQDTLWRLAEKSEWSASDTQHVRIRKLHEEILQMADQEAADGNLIVSRIRDAHNQQALREDEQRKNWRKLYDALDDMQRSRARPVLRRKLTPPFETASH